MRMIVNTMMLMAAGGLLALAGCDKKADASPEPAVSGAASAGGVEASEGEAVGAGETEEVAGASAKDKPSAAKPSVATAEAHQDEAALATKKEAAAQDVGSAKFTITGPAPWGEIVWGEMSSSQTIMSRQPNWVEGLASGTAKVGKFNYTWQLTLRLENPDNKGWRTGEFALPTGSMTGAHVVFLPVDEGAPHLGFAASSGKITITEVGPKGYFVNGKKNTAKVKGTFEAIGKNNKLEAGYTLKGEFGFLHII